MIALKTLLFTILIPGSVTVAIPYLLLTSGTGFTYEISSFRFIGIIPVALGIALYIWTAWDFAAIGKGTPAPIDPPTLLVSRRLYRTVRNPMYIAVLLVLVGEAIFFASLTLLIYAILLWFLFHLFVIFYEEPRLRNKFGPAYREYCKTVPRWIPNLRRQIDSKIQ